LQIPITKQSYRCILMNCTRPGLIKVDTLRSQVACRIKKRKGGRFEVGEDIIEGTVLDLIPDRRLVQSWRISSYGWPTEHFSQLSLDMREVSNGTHVTLEQVGVPLICLQYIKSGCTSSGINWAPKKGGSINENINC
jgi:hypothetical protein